METNHNILTTCRLLSNDVIVLCDNEFGFRSRYSSATRIIAHAQELIAMLPPSTSVVFRDEWQIGSTARISELFQLIDKDVDNVVGFGSPDAIARMRANATELEAIAKHV